MSALNNVLKAFVPNQCLPKASNYTLIGWWVLLLAVFWTLSPFKLLPTAPEVVSSMAVEWQQGVARDLLNSLFISLESIAWAMALGFGLCYLSTIPFFKAPVEAIGKLRFLSTSGILLIFFLATPNGHALKVAVLTFSILVYLLSDMLRVIDDIPQARFDYARTMGLNHWQVLREVVIRATLADGIESLRGAGAMGWMMLTMVEGLSRDSTGIGLDLQNLARSNSLAAIFGIQVVILLVGMGQDALLKGLKTTVCPYTNLKK